MHPKLAEALNLLGLDKPIGKTSPRQRAAALFQYLHLAGYLSEDSLGKAASSEQCTLSA